jgi:hypothetical protein
MGSNVSMEHIVGCNPASIARFVQPCKGSRIFFPRNSGYSGSHCTTTHPRKPYSSILTDCALTVTGYGHVRDIGEGRNAYRILAGKPKGKNHYEDIDVDGRMLKWTSEI